MRRHSPIGWYSVIKDRTNNFLDMDLVFDDDSQAILRNANQQRIDITTVIDRRTAQLVADRQIQQLFKRRNV